MVLNFTFTPTPSFKYGSNIQSRACCSIRDLTSGVGALSATTVLTVPFLAISSTNLIVYAPSAFLSIRIRSILQTMQRDRMYRILSHGAKRMFRPTFCSGQEYQPALVQPLRILIRPIEVVRRLIKFPFAFLGYRCRASQESGDLFTAQGFEGSCNFKRLLQD